MKKKDLELLIASGAVSSMTFSKEHFDSSSPGWELWAYPHPDSSMFWTCGNVLKTALQERRYFSSLDTAYSFARSCGWRDSISIEERFMPQPLRP